MTIAAADQQRRTVSLLQARAWTIANVSYHVPGGEVYRAYARELYEQDLHQRILDLFTTLDAQNAQVDAGLLLDRACPQDRIPPLMRNRRVESAGDSRGSHDRVNESAE